MFICLAAVCIETSTAEEENVFLKKEVVQIATSAKGDSGKRIRVHLFYKHKSYDSLLWSKERGVPDVNSDLSYQNINLIGHAEIEECLYVVYTDSYLILIDKFDRHVGFWQPVDTDVIYKGFLPLFQPSPLAEISSNDNGNIEVKLIEKDAIPTHPRTEIKYILDFEKKFILKSERSKSVTPPPATDENVDTK